MNPNLLNGEAGRLLGAAPLLGVIVLWLLSYLICIGVLIRCAIGIGSIQRRLENRIKSYEKLKYGNTNNNIGKGLDMLGKV